MVRFCCGNMARVKDWMGVWMGLLFGSGCEGALMKFKYSRAGICVQMGVGLGRSLGCRRWMVV